MLPHELPDLTPHYAGAIIIAGQDRFLWALGDQDRWERKSRVLHIPVSAIGGGVEAGERPHDSPQREAVEEIGAPFELIHAAVPEVCWLRADGEMKRALVPWNDGPAPAFVIRREVNDKTFVIWLYAARLTAEPKLDDLPGLVEVPLVSVPALLGGLRVDQLAAHGISITTKDGVKLTKATRLHLPEHSSERHLLEPTLRMRGLL